MRTLIIILAAALLFTGCKSTRRISTTVITEKDSTTYVETTTVKLDTILIESDTATLDAVIDAETGTLVSVDQTQADDVRIDYRVEKNAEGNMVVKVKAVTRPREVVTQEVTHEIARTQTSSDSIAVVEETKIKRNGSLWHLAWLVPLLIAVYVVIKKWKAITSMF